MDAPKRYQAIYPCHLGQVFEIDSLLAILYIEDREGTCGGCVFFLFAATKKIKVVGEDRQAHHPCDTTAALSVVKGLVLSRLLTSQ